NQTKVNYKLITAGTAGRACGLVEFAPGYEAGSRSVFSRAVVHEVISQARSSQRPTKAAGLFLNTKKKEA
ncbi:MAG: hypothetical protein PHW56_09060, partial [Methanosarcinaceae archaeon]|nr:hypothetical protein [Methanosarcinaceae archaeon]